MKLGFMLRDISQKWERFGMGSGCQGMKVRNRHWTREGVHPTWASRGVWVWRRKRGGGSEKEEKQGSVDVGDFWLWEQGCCFALCALSINTNTIVLLCHSPKV